MASSINASTSGPGGVITTADNSGILQIQSGGTTAVTVASTGTSIVGVTNGTNAATGVVGEFIDSQSGAVSVSTTGTAITSITLTAGDWDITGSAVYYGASGSTGIYAAINTTSGAATTGSLGQNYNTAFVSTGSGFGQASFPRIRANITTTTTYYLNAQLITTTNNCYGYISARRMR